MFLRTIVHGELQLYYSLCVEVVACLGEEVRNFLSTFDVFCVFEFALNPQIEPLGVAIAYRAGSSKTLLVNFQHVPSQALNNTLMDVPTALATAYVKM